MEGMAERKLEAFRTMEGARDLLRQHPSCNELLFRLSRLPDKGVLNLIETLTVDEWVDVARLCTVQAVGIENGHFSVNVVGERLIAETRQYSREPYQYPLFFKVR